MHQLNRPPIRRPVYARPCVCTRCGVRFLSPRAEGKYCPSCYRKITGKTTMDKTTRKILRKTHQKAPQYLGDRR